MTALRAWQDSLLLLLVSYTTTHTLYYTHTHTRTVRGRFVRVWEWGGWGGCAVTQSLHPLLGKDSLVFRRLYNYSAKNGPTLFVFVLIYFLLFYCSKRKYLDTIFTTFESEKVVILWIISKRLNFLLRLDANGGFHTSQNLLTKQIFMIFPKKKSPKIFVGQRRLESKNFKPKNQQEQKSTKFLILTRLVDIIKMVEIGWQFSL